MIVFNVCPQLLTMTVILNFSFPLVLVGFMFIPLRNLKLSLEIEEDFLVRWN